MAAHEQLPEASGSWVRKDLSNLACWRFISGPFCIIILLVRKP